ncbi:MAG TPA: monofunctional biosynthetic peptidoglycan transglycosylase, partial [Bacteroidota bacterium]
LPFGDISRLKTRNPPETEFMRIHAETAKREGRPFRKQQYWVSLRDVPKHVIDAVIVAEDGTFWRHGGFDWFEVKESLERNISTRRVARGGSTITQQLVKNLYLSPSKNPLRKVREWVLTGYMESVLSKPRILELYVNVIELGNGVYGIQAASRKYFGKDVSELTRYEAAQIASIIPNPRRHRPDDSSRFVLRRSALILERMGARGM